MAQCVWTATEKQQIAHRRPERELFFGGARGGGKSGFLLADWFVLALLDKYPWQGIMFRKTYKELEEITHRSHAILPRLGATWNGTEKTWRLKRSLLRMRYLDSVADAGGYHGHEYQWIGIDEAGNYRSPAVINLMRGCMRTTHEGQPTYLRMTGNPGGVGHEWLKARFMEPMGEGKKWPPGVPFCDPVTKQKRIFIPSFLEDMPHIRNKEEYIENLKAVGAAHLVKAWLNGDWDVKPQGGLNDVAKIGKGEPPPWARIVVGIDPAVSPKEEADCTAFVVMAVWRVGRAMRYCYLYSEKWRKGLDYSTRRIFELVKIWKPAVTWLEGGPCGVAMEDSLRKGMISGEKPFNLIMSSHMQDKTAKNAGQQAAIGSGLVSSTKDGPWWQDHEDQLAEFSGAKEGVDDLVDAGGIIFRQDFIGLDEPQKPAAISGEQRVLELVKPGAARGEKVVSRRAKHLCAP